MHSLALTATGQVFAWGDNNEGELGTGAVGPSQANPVQVQLPTNTTVTAVAAGNGFSLAVTSTGSLLAWGLNLDGRLGTGTVGGPDPCLSYNATACYATPQPVSLPAGVTITAVVTGDSYSLALTSTGAVLAWGTDYFGALGIGSAVRSLTPALVTFPGDPVVTAIAATGDHAHSLALTSTGGVFAWGANDGGQLGNGALTQSNTPVPVSLPSGTSITAIAAADDHNLAVTSTGAVLAWGYGQSGQLGTGQLGGPDACTSQATGCQTTPVLVNVPAGTAATAVAAGLDFSLALTTPSQPSPSPTPTGSRLNVPLFYQTDPQWALDLYGDPKTSNPYGCGAIRETGDSKPTNNDIYHCGCLLTSWAMVLSYYSASATTPDILNSWLQSHSGYDTTLDIYQSSVLAYGMTALGLGLGPLQPDPHWPSASSDAHDKWIDAELAKGVPVILGVNNEGHFVVATGKTTDAGGHPTWWINDPVHGIVKFSDYYASYSSLQWAEVQPSGSLPGNLASMTFNLASPAELLVTDPQGRRSGLDPRSGTAYSEIPGAGYDTIAIAFSDTGAPVTGHPVKTLYLPNPIDGVYTVQVIGTGVGPYTFSSLRYDHAGVPTTTSVSGQAQIGSDDLYQVLYPSNAPPTTPVVDAVVTGNAATPTSAITSPPVSTTAGNELVLALVSADGPTAPTQSVSAVSGGGLAWSLVARANSAWGTAEVWSAYATTRLGSVVVTATLQAGGYDGSITVATFSGASLDVGASSIGAGSTGAPGDSLVTTKADSEIWAVGQDYSRAVTHTAISGQNMVAQSLDTRVGETFWTQTTTNPVAAAGTVVKVGDTSPTTDRWDLAAVEVTPALAAAPGFGTDMVRTTDQTTPASSFTSPPISTSVNGELLLAMVSTDGPTQPTQSVGGVTGGGLTWTRAVSANAGWGAAEVWQAYATNLVSGATVTATLTSGGYDGSITVVAFTGAAPTIGATGAQAATSGPPAVSVSTTVAGSMVWGVGHDWSHAAAVTPASGQALVNQFLDRSVHDSSWAQETGLVPVAGTVVDVADGGPMTDRWDIVGVEVVPAPLIG